MDTPIHTSTLPLGHPAHHYHPRQHRRPESPYLDFSLRHTTAFPTPPRTQTTFSELLSHDKSSARRLPARPCHSHSLLLTQDSSLATRSRTLRQPPSASRTFGLHHCHNCSATRTTTCFTRRPFHSPTRGPRKGRTIAKRANLLHMVHNQQPPHQCRLPLPRPL